MTVARVELKREVAVDIFKEKAASAMSLAYIYSLMVPIAELGTAGKTYNLTYTGHCRKNLMHDIRYRLCQVEVAIYFTKTKLHTFSLAQLFKSRLTAGSRKTQGKFTSSFKKTLNASSQILPASIVAAASS